VQDHIRVEPAVDLSDEEVRARVDEAIRARDASWRRHIAVTVSRGRVRLAGFVHDAHQRDDAESIAGEVEGVRSVENLILVDPQGAREDEAILRDAWRALEKTGAETAGLELKSVERNLLMRGSIADPTRTRAVDRALRSVRGVRSVTLDTGM
jgi:osmotically-inducible protein OsmY